jgi:hypothetical protein
MTGCGQRHVLGYGRNWLYHPECDACANLQDRRIVASRNLVTEVLPTGIVNERQRPPTLDFYDGIEDE